MQQHAVRTRRRVEQEAPSRRATPSRRAVEVPRSLPEVATLVLACSDAAALLASGAAVSAVAGALGSTVTLTPWLPALVWLALTPVSAWRMRLYPGFGLGGARELRRLTLKTSVVYAVVCWTALFLFGDLGMSPVLFLASWAASVALVPIARALVRGLLSRCEWWGEPVIVLGAGRLGRTVVNKLSWNPDLGLRPIAFLDDNGCLVGTEVCGLPVAGPLSMAPRFASPRIRRAIIAMRSVSDEDLAEILDTHLGAFREVSIVGEAPEIDGQVVSSREICGLLAFETRKRLPVTVCRQIKRAVDIALILAGAVVVVPLMALIALLVKLDSRGPVFYSQRRVGLGGRTFHAFKFRTMVEDAEERLREYLEDDLEASLEWERSHKLQHDPRVTRVGRLLRNLSLDELPQLWNVLRGEMSLVGPRPIVEEEIAKYDEDFVHYSAFRPGLTGLWQVSGRNDTTYEERVALDACYVRNWSIWLDLHILVRTVSIVLNGKGAY